MATDPRTDHLHRIPPANKLPHQHQIPILDPSTLNLLPPSRHREVICKVILRFHAIHWPVGFPTFNPPLPRHILTHPHWAINRRKIIMNTGNAADPLFALSELDVDAVRWYIPHGRGIGD